MWLKSHISKIKTHFFIDKYLRVQPKDYITVQNAELCRLLTFACKYVPAYQSITEEFGDINEHNSLKILKSFPLLSKADIISNPALYRANFVDEKWPNWHNTGGSTGNPLHFPIGGRPRWTYSPELLCQAKLYCDMAGDYKSIRISSVDGRRVSDAELDEHIYWGRNDEMFPYGLTHYSTMYLNKETFAYYINKLNQEKPDVLRGYPSGIYEIARLIKENGTVLDFSLKAIYLTSENILQHQVELIEEIFQCPVWGQYGHSEASIFAVRAPGQSGYICNPLYGYTEIIKENGEPAAVGEAGEIVVTGFCYYAQPFIRYRTGDIAINGGIVDGQQELRELLGRSNDYAIDIDGNKKYLVGLIFGGHLEAFNHICAWQLQQDIPGELSVKIVKGDDYNDGTEAEITNFFQQNGFAASILYVDSIEKTKRGKTPFMIQNIKQ